jgi:hypothetical protein
MTTKEIQAHAAPKEELNPASVFALCLEAKAG